MGNKCHPTKLNLLEQELIAMMIYLLLLHQQKNVRQHKKKNDLITKIIGILLVLQLLLS